MSEAVTYVRDGNVAIITLNRPEARNAVNGDVASAMEAAIDRLESDDGVWVGILLANTAGQERPVFCAGADLKAINSGDAARLNTQRGGFGGIVYRERRLGQSKISLQEARSAFSALLEASRIYRSK